MSRGVDRRRFLTGAAALAGLTVATRMPSAAAQVEAGSPFTLGVASGEPAPHGFLLWTRLARDPLNGGGMPNEPINVQWQVATDEAFSNVVKQGTFTAKPAFAHSVHVAVSNLPSNRWFFYRFRAQGFISRTGRTRTMPGLGSSPRDMQFAFVSCQDYQAGYYHAYDNLAQEDLDLVVHLGDYTYEYGPEQATSARLHSSDEVITLSDYRNRHAQYKTDLDLQEAHAAFPFVVTFDDHEVENNYADEIPEEGSNTPSRDAFLRRRAAAYRAYYEHMPLGTSSLPKGPDMRLYRRSQFGNLARFVVLDTRQYRTDQPCGDGIKDRCPEALAPSQTMTGPAQETWVKSELDNSKALWNLIGQQTMLAEYDFQAGPGELFNMDQWDGYVAARNRLLGFLLQRRPSNPVVLTGDIHSSWVHDLKSDFDNPSSTTVGTEFVGTSITSDFPPPFIAPIEAARPDNPHTKFFDGTFRGYVVCDLNRTRMKVDFRIVGDVKEPAPQPATTLATFEVQNGRPGAERV